MICGHFSASLEGDKGQEHEGDEHLPHLHLHLKDAVLSSSPMGRTRQGGPHAGEQGDPVMVNGGTKEGPGLKTTPDLRQHINGCHIKEAGQAQGGEGLLLPKCLPYCGEIREGCGHNLTFSCNIYTIS